MLRLEHTGILMADDPGETCHPVGRVGVEVRRAPVTFKMARVSGLSYYATLRRKLHWGTQPRYNSDDEEESTG